MQHELSGKIAVVTGASRGIGRATALRLGEMGAAVCVHYHSASDKAGEVVAAIAAAGSAAFAVQADLSQHDGPAKLLASIDAELIRRHGSPAFDILVNNAGTGTRAVIEDATEEEFDRVIQVDLRAPFFLIQGALKRMRDGGRIINVSSMATRAAFPAMAIYAPAKAGLEAL